MLHKCLLCMPPSLTHTRTHTYTRCIVCVTAKSQRLSQVLPGCRVVVAGQVPWLLAMNVFCFLLHLFVCVFFFFLLPSRVVKISCMRFGQLSLLWCVVSILGFWLGWFDSLSSTQNNNNNSCHDDNVMPYKPQASAIMRCCCCFYIHIYIYVYIYLPICAHMHASVCMSGFVHAYRTYTQHAAATWRRLWQKPCLP